MQSSPPPFWQPDRHAARRPALALRARIKTRLRGWFDAQGFVEVETGIVQASPGNETHLHAFETHWIDHGGESARGYLHTSPEFAMKKLLAAGENRIYQFAPVFRAREISALHAPEFVMLEWYRARADYTTLMADCAALLRLTVEAGGARIARYRGRECDLLAAPERLSMCDAFTRHAGIALETVLTDRDGLAEAARQAGIRIAPDDGWGDIFSRILSERIEPQLGQGCATILDRYPMSEAALARPRLDDPRFAERFELYICGVELANAFGELTDAAEQRQRFEADMAEKKRIYGIAYPLDEDFLAALPLMPAASGIALGFDRLVMLTAGAERISDVMFTPWNL